jgi:alginate O-acetyltransferase complex protein AlgI
MLFNSFVFAGLFLPICLLAFWLAPSPSSKRAVLLFGSLVFYGYWLPAYLILLVGFVGVAWACAQLAEKTDSTWPVWLAALFLLGGLAYYKYAGFFSQVAVDLHLAPSGFRIPQLALPLGISFIVFQALGYVIDVHRREFSAEKRFSVVLLFKAFFPQLIAGPICRAHELIPQLRGTFNFRLEQFASGLAIFALGLALKQLFADGLAPLVDTLYSNRDSPSFYGAWAASIGFGGQIYADFWGYSTMAVGLARMFSIDIPTNFNLPYLATSLREFWRRWHITLSQWLRDYLYKPLGGSRHGRLRTMAALLITMLLGGFWHGANYTFIVWGAIHGLALVFEHQVIKGRLNYNRWNSLPLRGITFITGWMYTFLVVFSAWVFFRAANVDQAAKIIAAMLSPQKLTHAALSVEMKQIATLALLLFLIQIPITWALRQLRDERWSPAVAVTIAFWAVVVAIVFGAPIAVPFIYFQF